MSIISKPSNELTLAEKRALLVQLLREKANKPESLFPLSHGQQALWFLYKLAPQSWAYNTLFTVRIRSEVDIPGLRRAFQELISRHPSLRTTYTERDGKPLQQLHEDLEVHFEEIDASMQNWEELKQQVAQAAHCPFNLEQGPVVRVSLFTHSSRDHILLLAIHHIASDFWSQLVLMDELRVLYQAQKAGILGVLPNPTLSYVDYVHWQNEMLAGSVGERLWAYWQKQLAGELPLLNLPTDRPRPPVQTYQGASHSFRLSEKLAQRLKGLAQAEGVTLYMTLLAAFQVLLYRYTGQEDILVGSPTFGRTQRELARIVGYFVNPVVLRTDLSGNPSFKTFLTQVHQTVLAAIAHQDYPFALLVERLQPQRDSSRSPIFQVSFALQKPQQFTEVVELLAPSETEVRVDWGGMELEPFAIVQQEGQFDLILEMVEAREALFGVFKYNTDLFDATTIARMAEHFQTLLAGIVTNPLAQVAELPLLSPTERQQLLVEWNNTQADYPLDAFIHQLFETQVERTPEAVALVCADQQLTYRELNCRANQLAHYLKALGVGPEVLVGICVERSLEMVVGLLGILKAGGAYVPLDPAYPQERLAFMLQDSQVPVLLTQKMLMTRLPEHQARVVCLDTDWGVIAQESQENPVSGVKPDNLAYVIYTSGSTGQPKGVQISHQSAINFLNSMRLAPGLTDRDILLAVTTISFDIAALELYLPLIVGARVVLVSREVTTDGSQMLERLVNSGATVMQATPATWRLLLAAGWEGKHQLKILVGGEALPRELATQLLEKGSSVWNLYGPTEATIWSAAYKVEASRLVTRGQDASESIGRPIANTQIYILDRYLQPVPIGVFGELYIGGDGLARGYLNRPDLTAEKFIHNPYSDDPSAHLYKTGDLACYLPDGNIQFLGRLDHQVKLRGFRIELGEIEAALAKHPEVREAVVIVREDQLGNNRLVAYIVSNQKPSVTASELRRHLQRQLPDYMVPSAFVFLNALPLTPNGKVDHRALPAPDTASLSQEASFVPPRTPTEAVLAAIWADILGVEVGIHDNFFELGGHSLLVTQVISRVRQAFEVDLPLRILFESSTIAEFGQAIEARRQAGLGLQAPAIEPVPRDIEVPLSFAQARLWFLDQLEGRSATYNIPAAMRLIGPLDLSALEQAFTTIVQRHEVLRTTFTIENGSLVQAIAPIPNANLSVLDLQALPESEQATCMQQLATSEQARPFDLSIGPLIRLTLLKLGEQFHVLLVTMHHIVSDGWSLGIFIRELSTLYAVFAQGAPSPLPELPIQYADFAVWQRQWLSGEVLETQLTYWRQQLAGAPPVLELPTDRVRPPVQTFRGGSENFQLNRGLTQQLLRLSQKAGVTLFMTLLAAFMTLLSRYSNQSDIVVGSPIANRNRTEIESLIGFFVNTLVLRTNLSGNPSFSELLTRVRQVTLDAYAHQDVPFEKLVEELQPERSISHSPLFQVMFAFQNIPMRELELPGLTLTPVELESITAKFDLTLSMTETQQGDLLGTWEYNSDLFDATTITRMTGHFQTLLEGVVANPEQRVSELPILTAAERHQLLVEWNDTQREYPFEKCIHQLFEAQVERTPDVVAVVWEERQLTYQELNTRANQLAHHLQALGVGPEVLVGICVDRSLEMVVALLGILKAGGVYVPLDPAYPQERLSSILSDSQVLMLLTQEKLVAKLPEHEARVVCLDADWGVISQESEENPVSGVQPENLAYVIYTSGSTGKPKGVQIAHQSVVNFLNSMRLAPGLTDQDILLAITTISFDIAALELYLPLIVGARVVLVSREVATDRSQLWSKLVNSGCTVMQATPVTWRLLLADGWQDKHQLKILVGGEAVPQELANQLLEKGTSVWNLYGPTETTIWSAVYQMRTNRMVAFTKDAPESIGHPIANTQLYILDRHLQPVPVGVPGELHIGGAGLARGYLNRPDLTEAKFIPNPFSDEPRARLYKTGDLARYLPDGNIEFLGRFDHQVKIRGFRIELGEVESALAQHPTVQQTVVITREDSPGKQRLVAYIVPHQEQAPTSDELHRFLKQKLPAYMVPNAFVMLEDLPLTPNGKVDRRALPAPDLRPHLQAAYVMPQTEAERLIATVWQETLQLEKVGIHDNFFELGGHSLLTVEIHRKLQEILGQELSIVEIFQFPTIHSFAKHLSQKESEQSASGQSHNRAEFRCTRQTSMQQQRQFRQKHRSTNKH